MKKMLPHSEWLKTLPKKRMGVAVLLFNEQNELLIVKQTYRDKWAVPGGVIDENESPEKAGLRETSEEIGLNLESLQFLGVQYLPKINDNSEAIEFIFTGGVLTTEQIKNIKLEEDEISDYQFLKTEEALPMLLEETKNRISVCLENPNKNIPIYFEYKN
jgi:ADP-ribose pyrophosphatase YjhB (NUDIX family)